MNTRQHLLNCDNNELNDENNNNCENNDAFKVSKPIQKEMSTKVASPPKAFASKSECREAIYYE